MKLKKGIVVTFLLVAAFSINTNKNNLDNLVCSGDKEDIIIEIYDVA